MADQKPANNCVYPIPVSILVQTKNEENGIRSCLESWLPHFSEVIVVDSESDDRTASIARDMGIRVVEFKWNGQYPKKKQWQLENLTTREEWVLFVDADEFTTSELIQEMRHTFEVGPPADFAAYDIKLNYRFAGALLRHGHTVVKRSLVHKSRVSYPVMDDLEAPGMGELEGHYQPVAHGTVGKLTGRILHDDQDPIRTWFDRHNKYSDWEAYLRTNPAARSQASKARSAQGKIFDRMPIKPLLFFLYSFVLRRGFADGRAGLNYAIALSTYYWQIELKVNEIKGWQR